MWLFYYFNFERSYDVLNSKSPCILLKKNTNFLKICVLSQCIVYSMLEYKYFYISKNIRHTLLLLVSKIIESLISLNAPTTFLKPKLITHFL